MTDGVVLRTDAKGRVVVTRDRRAALLEEFGKSGMSGAQFAKWAGVKYSTFAYWVQQCRKEQRRKGGGGPTELRGEPGPDVQWLEAVVALQAQANNLYVCADSGGSNPLIANRGSYSTWEEFAFVIVQ